MNVESRNNLPVLLFAEDDEDDYLLVQDARREAQCSARLFWVKNGEELMDYLFHRGPFENPKDSPRPDLLLLDLNMPKKDGRRALEEIKAHPRFRTIPVVVLTTSENREDILHCYTMGANAFVQKPARFGGIVEAMKVLQKFWFETAALPSR